MQQRHLSAVVLDERAVDHNLKKHQENTIVKSTIKKMFGQLGGDGYDEYNNSEKRLDINLAFIKRKLDKEMTDDTKKIVHDTANPTPNINLQSGRNADLLDRATMRSSILDQMKMNKMAKMNYLNSSDASSPNIGHHSTKKISAKAK